MIPLARGSSKRLGCTTAVQQMPRGQGVVGSNLSGSWAYFQLIHTFPLFVEHP